jgi:outer membrane receptor protein involved in Fe transport
MRNNCCNVDMFATLGVYSIATSSKPRAASAPEQLDREVAGDASGQTNAKYTQCQKTSVEVVMQTTKLSFSSSLLVLSGLTRPGDQVLESSFRDSGYGHSCSTIHRWRAFSLALVLLAMAALATEAGAQTTSTIEGTVKDVNGAAIGGAQIKVTARDLAIERTTNSSSNGTFRIAALPAGRYTVTTSQTGFASRVIENVELTLNRTLTLDIQLEVGAVQERVGVTAAEQLLEPTASSIGGTVTPRQIVDLPVNGRDYLDLLQLIPGVTINRQADPGSDNATPVLGERGGNTNFLIDGQPNKDTVNGGPAAQFNQETIAEFQVLTTSYKAEFGQATGAIVNVITKSGGNDYHGVASLFHRNSAFDTSNSLDKTTTDAPFLLRWDYSFALGGRLVKDKVFFFGSSERITESRRLDFVFPEATPQVVRNFEESFNNPTKNFETRNFIKFDEQLGRHHLTEQMNYTNGVIRDFLPLSQSTSLPSTRNDFGARHLLLGLSDTALLGDQGRPWLLNLRFGYRGEPSDQRPSHPDAGPSTLFNLFDSLTTGGVFGNLGSVQFGNGVTPTNLDQKYTSFSASVDKYFGPHDLKFGWGFLRTKVDGLESSIVRNQLFATLDDFSEFGPINSGFFTLTTVGGLTPQDNEIHLDNNYNGLYVQDDWKILRSLTLNLGLRWDHDSEFPNNKNFSPRVGAAWAINSKTVIRGHFGVFYDQFRLGLARDVPPFGGADRRVVQPFSYPRGFYGIPTIAPILVGLCLSPTLTDAQIAASGAKCPFGPLPFFGVDHLNKIVASGHASIPADAVINIATIQMLSGLTPEQYADQASASIGRPAGFFFFGPFGALTHAVIPAQPAPVTIDDQFRTPHTLSYSIGIQREITKDIVVEANYYHRDIRNILGVRQTNLGFISRVPGHERTFEPPFTTGEIDGFGPWFEGTYDGLTLSFNKRFSRRFIIAGSYSYSHQTDNNSSGIAGLPSDSFIGIVPEVTEDSTGKTNKSGSFTTTNGHFIPQAGTFSNGPDLDKGPSDLSLAHMFQVNGLVELPWGVQISSIFRAQSGFHFSRIATTPEDPDGNLNFNDIDHGPGAGRNAFTAPPFVNADVRFSKRFDIGDRLKFQFLFEFFNLFNNANPAAVERGAGRPIPFGTASQVLPGREGQVGLRIEF